jgi:hypothetical protein
VCDSGNWQSREAIMLAERRPATISSHVSVDFALSGVLGVDGSAFRDTFSRVESAGSSFNAEGRCNRFMVEIPRANAVDVTS